VHVLTGGLEEEPAILRGHDGADTETGPHWGITIVDVPSREDALEWAAEIAAACRCAQDVRAIGFDPEFEVMLDKVAVDVDSLKTRGRG
jgi:hypothetical protein